MQRGEEGAFEEIVRRHQGRMYAVAYRLTGNREDARDITQEALMKAHNRIHSWKPTGGFVGWLLRLTTNHGIDHLRRAKRRKHERLDEGYLPRTEGAAVEPAHFATETAVRGREIDERIREALQVLSPAQTTVFLLRHYEGFRLAEIAEQMNCTVGSVKVHLFRALKKLRVELKDLMD